MRLLKKMLNIFTNRLFIYAVMILIQIVLTVLAFVFLSKYVSYLSIIFSVLGWIICIVLMNRKINSAYKLSWIILILGFSPLGAIAFLIVGKNRFGRKKTVKIIDIVNNTSCLLSQNQDVFNSVSNDNVAHKISSYINNTTSFPIEVGENLSYYPLGDDFFKDFLVDLQNAKDYIFMEYFIIESGVMWDSILSILKQKVSEGVDVRVMYDDVGCMFTVPRNFDEKLQDMGIKAYRFNPFKPVMNVQMNNRSHRKITAIDGKVAYTGGLNLADEYINKKVKHGHWKDSAIRMEGACVANFTIMFLQLWAMKNGIEENYSKYFSMPVENKGLSYVQPFSDSPYDKINTYEDVYIMLLYSAKKYVYINTPYLIISDEMKKAIVTAVRAGVDVRLTVPHIPDKKFVFILTTAFYKELIELGVKVYEYTPGFIHSKSFVCDDKYAIIGTSNLDYRSLYLHFECGAFVFDPKIALAMKNDFVETLDKCEEKTMENVKTTAFSRVAGAILRILAPLL